MRKIVLLLCLISVNVFAATPSTQAPASHEHGSGQANEQRFSEFKQLRIEGVQSRIAILQTTLSCIQAAQKHEEMKQCEETSKTAMENLKQQQEQKFQALKQSATQGHAGMGQSAK